jgi:hypothetical protein
MQCAVSWTISHDVAITLRLAHRVKQQLVAQPLTSKFAAYDAFEKRERCTRVQRPPTSIQYLLLDAVLNLQFTQVRNPNTNQRDAAPS